MAEVNIQRVIDGHISPQEFPEQVCNETSDFCSRSTHINDFNSSTPVSTKYNNRRKYIYLFGGFIVSSCLAAIACSVLLMVIVMKPNVHVTEMIAESSLQVGYHNGEVNDMRCLNTTLHRINARAKYAEVENFDTHIAKKFKPVCCVDIPKDKCDGILPYEKTFFPNEIVSSSTRAVKYLESVETFMNCDPNALYVFCAMVYPPCIKDTRQVMPCKSVCEGVFNGCQEANTSVSIDSKLSCDNYPVGESDEIVCQSSSYAVNIDIGEEFDFTSPNYPGDIPSNTNVVWSITSPEHTRIQIDIMDVNIDKQLKQELTIKFGQNPYGSTLHKQSIDKDRVVLTHLNFASVTFKSGEMPNGNVGFTAKTTVLRIKDTLLCETNARPINEEDLCNGVYDCVDCDGNMGCVTCDDATECFDETKCRPPCGYNLVMSSDATNEILSSPPYSGSYEDCIYTFKAPTRFRIRLQFLDHSGLVSDCNFKYGYGDNPFNVASEIPGIPEVLTEIDFPDNFGWIWLASSSVNTSFVIRVSAFSDDLVLNLAADETYIIDTTEGSAEIANALERGTITVKSPPGYHLTLSCLNDILEVELNNVLIGIGSKPMKNNVYIIYDDYDEVFEFFTDAIWLKMFGVGVYEIGFKIMAVQNKEVDRISVQVDQATNIVYPIPTDVLNLPVDCVENGHSDKVIDIQADVTMEELSTATYVTSTYAEIVEDEDETVADSTIKNEYISNIFLTTWIVTSVRHPTIGVKFLYFNSSYDDFNYITIGHGLNPDDSSSIVFNGAVMDYKHRLPDDFIVRYSSFWVRHTCFSDAKDTMFSLELNGVENIDDLVCPLKFGVTNDDICDDKYDCPDLSDETNCGDKGECGHRPFHQRKKRVIGGSEASLGDYPWHGLIMIDGYSHCGSTLINNNFVITASHCLWHDTNNANKLEVMFASISNKKFSEKHLVVEASALFFFPQDLSLSDAMDHDIALIKLKHPVPFTNYVRPVCLLRNETQFPPGHQCYISGFGRQVIWALASELHSAPMTLYSNEKCMDFQSNLFKITDNIVCAGERDGGVGTCYGDSGGPLVCPDEDGLWYLRGLTSFGHTCANIYRPGAFTRVGRYLDFINMIMDSVSTIEK